MVSGLPDYFRGVDVAYQALTQMIVRPKYGGARIASGSKEITDASGNTLVTIAGKGMTYGGNVWLDYTSTQANSVVGLVIDGEQITDLSFLRLLQYGIDKPRAWPVSINLYDATNFIYSVGISYGITFETSIALTISRHIATSPTVHYRLVYTLV